jgi:hypothetical protein
MKISNSVELDPMYSKWVRGIAKLQIWYNAVYNIAPELVWTMPNDGTFHKSQDILMWETKDVREYLADVLNRGYWREEEKYILNGMRKFYLLNQRWGMEVDRYVTTIVTI